MAEVVLGVGVLGVLDEFGQEDVGVEEVDAHGDVDHLGIEGGADSGLFGLLFEAGDLAVAGDLDDTEGGDLVGADGERGQGDVGTGVLMLLEHEAVVHLVDVVAGEDEDVSWAPRSRWSRCSGRRRRRCPGTRSWRRAAWGAGSR